MKILKIKKQNLSGIVKEAAEAIKGGQIVVCPTDTVYGLICDATNKKAVRKIYKIKQRPKNKLLPVFVKDLEMAKKIIRINPGQEKLLKKVWPGSVTVVIQKEQSALRVPKYRLITDIIKKLNRPLSETSANISGEPPTAKIAEVLQYFKRHKHKPDLVLDAGDLKTSKPSRVVDLTGSKPKVLRK